MDVLNKKIKIVHNAVNVVGMTFAMALFFNSVYDLNIHWTVIALTSSMVFMVLLLMRYNSKSILTYIVIFSGITCGLTIMFLSKIDILKYIEAMSRWFFEYQATGEDYQIVYALTITVIFIGMVSIVCYITNKNGILRYSIVLGLMIVLVYCAVEEIEVNKLTLAIFLIYMTQTAVNFCNKAYNNKNQDHQIANIYMLPLCVGIGILAVALPSQSQPIQWTAVKQTINFVLDKADDVLFYLSNLKGESFDAFGINFAGYSDKEGDVLGGWIKDSNRIILKVSPVMENNSSIYLTGNISDDYNTDRWKKTNIDYKTDQEPMVDFYEMLHGLYQNKVVPKETETLFHNVKLNVNYDKIKTRTVFYPLKTAKIKLSDDKLFYESNSPSLMVDKSLKKGFSYQVNYYELNYGSETIQDYFRKISKINISHKKTIAEQKVDQEAWTAYLKDVLDINHFEETFITEDFQILLDERSDVIKEYYTKIPDQLPKRVYELAEQITVNYDNNYDKLKAIEAYLSTFKYNLSPSKTNEGADFVDYFLFEQKEGYCTYFATAMAVLSRCIGIPTRYVKGVLLDDKTKEGRDYFVSNNAAHAWVEAYIEGFGWVPFEPTPKMYEDRYSQWAQRVVPQYKDLSASIMEALEEELEELEDLDKQENDIHAEKTKRSKYMLFLSIVIIAIIFILLVGVVAALNYSKKKKYQRATKQGKARYLVIDIMDYLKAEGSGILVGETLTDYGLRLGKRYDMEAFFLEEVFSIYTKMHYGEGEIDESELRKIVLYREGLKKYMIKKFGWAFILKYRFSLLTS